MKLIVAVYDDWGIGKDGTQPVALSVDRKFFRQTTAGACVVVGRKTLADFPGGQPLPKRCNVVLSRRDVEIPGAVVLHSPEEVLQFTKDMDSTFVIGGGSVYRLLLPYCDTAYVTKVHCTPESDTFFPDLDQDPQWKLAQILLSGEENGIGYEMCLYKRKNCSA